MRVKSRQTPFFRTPSIHPPSTTGRGLRSTSICVCCVYEGCIHHPWMDALGLGGCIAPHRIASQSLLGARLSSPHPWA